MKTEWLILVIGALMGAYGVWAIRRDLARGRASARGFRFDRATQPLRYRVLMTFNCLAVGLILLGAGLAGANLIGRALSHPAAAQLRIGAQRP